MSNELSVELHRYLKHCGTPEGKIARCNHDTRMYHDLDIWGEVADDYLEALADEFYVDFTGFVFEKYFPPEFEGKNVLTATLLLMVPFVTMAIRKRRVYWPLTLGMIEDAIRSKKWQAAEVAPGDACNRPGA